MSPKLMVEFFRLIKIGNEFANELFNIFDLDIVEVDDNLLTLIHNNNIKILLNEWCTTMQYATARNQGIQNEILKKK